MVTHLVRAPSFHIVTLYGKYQGTCYNVMHVLMPVARVHEIKKRVSNSTQYTSPLQSTSAHNYVYFCTTLWQAGHLAVLEFLIVQWEKIITRHWSGDVITLISHWSHTKFKCTYYCQASCKALYSTTTATEMYVWWWPYRPIPRPHPLWGKGLEQFLGHGSENKATGLSLYEQKISYWATTAAVVETLVATATELQQYDWSNWLKNEQ